MYQVEKINAFTDNFIWALIQGNHCVLVDPGCANSALNFLSEHQLTLTDILITHHHKDHIGGINELHQHFPELTIYGPSTHRFPMVTKPCEDGQSITLLDNITLNVLALTGHTIDHIGFYDQHNAFVGDTLFSAGCGRLFEGSPEQMFNSLSKLAQLDHATNIYCAHEYTLANIEFALAVDPDNADLLSYQQTVTEQLTQGIASIPTNLQQESKFNPFLRANELAIKRQVTKKFELTYEPNELECFALIRKWKDNF